MVALAFFQALADLYPDDEQKRFEILKNTPLVGTVLNKSDAPSTGYGYAGETKKKRWFGRG